jgi:hypothetical protein
MKKTLGKTTVMLMPRGALRGGDASTLPLANELLESSWHLYSIGLREAILSGFSTGRRVVGQAGSKQAWGMSASCSEEFAFGAFSTGHVHEACWSHPMQMTGQVECKLGRPVRAITQKLPGIIGSNQRQIALENQSHSL